MIRWLILFTLLSFLAMGQQSIEGKVVDKETGRPIPFASIGILGTSKGTSSNVEGHFSLSIAGPISIKVTCIGYESRVLPSVEESMLIELVPTVTQLSEVVILKKSVNASRVVRRAFAGIQENYDNQPFLQKFFYRHYCKDNTTYGRLIEASVDVWKHQGYHSFQKSAGSKEEIRVTQLRRSLDKTAMAQGHEPISVKDILEADVAGYQTSLDGAHISFYTDVSNLKSDFNNYSFTFGGVTYYDGQEVYLIRYRHKKDSVLTTSGYKNLPEAQGLLFITTDTYAFIKAEDEKKDGPNTIKTTAYYRKYENRYYPYHFIREGENHAADKSVHRFHIDLISVEVRHGAAEKFAGQEPGKDELLKIPYDSVFWSNNTVLKTTPLEDDIIRDLGGGNSLSQQFLLYKQYELNLSDGGHNGEQKFNWLRQYSKGKKILYIGFWSSACEACLKELEYLKRLQKHYRNDVTFILLSSDDDELRWKQSLTRYNLYADGLIHYRVGRFSKVEKEYKIKEVPGYVLVSRDGLIFSTNARHPSDALVEEDFKTLMKQDKKM